MRKKFILDSMRDKLQGIESENQILRQLIAKHSSLSPTDVSRAIASTRTNRGSDGSAAAQGFADAHGRSSIPLLASDGAKPLTILDNVDYCLIDALTTGSRSFVLCDPKLPDNPIVYASSGFYTLTGYGPSQVLGRNCRFLQGPLTDPEAIAQIRNNIIKGTDTSVLLVNYRADGTTFWNRFFVAPLRDLSGSIVSFVGVQEEVSPSIVERLIKNQSAEVKKLHEGFKL